MQPIATDGVVWSVSHNHEPCNNSWTNQDAIWEMDSGGLREPRIR